MLKLYVFWGLLGLVLLGVAVQLIRNRSRRPQAPAAEAKAIHKAGPDASAREAPFDPTATRIHIRPAPAITNSALPERDEALLPDGAVATLGCVGGHLKGRSFRVTEAGITVGRDPESDIVLSDHRVSHRHAWLGIIDRKVVLRDLDSTNGTFLNANLDALVHEIVLSPGDTIFFGGHGGDQFRFMVN